MSKSSNVPLRRCRVLVHGAALVLSLGLLAGCSETGDTTDAADSTDNTSEQADEGDLCATYDDAVAQAEELRSWDPQTDDLDDARARAADFRAELDELQAVADGRLDDAITSLRTTINDFVATVVDQGREAVDAARPALQNARAELVEAWSVVEQVAENECGDS